MKKKSLFIIQFFILLSWFSTEAQNNAWCVVMTERNFAQTYNNSLEFPTEYIKGQWKKAPKPNLQAHYLKRRCVLYGKKGSTVKECF